MPTRVMYLNHGAKPSGAEFALLRLLTAIDRSKVTPVMVFGEEGPMVQAMRDIGVETHVMPLTDKVKEIRKDTLKFQALLGVGKLALVGAYAAKIASFARKHRIDVIHTNTIKAHCYGALASRMAGVPLVWHIRDFVNDSYFPAPAVKVFRTLAKVMPSHVVAVSGSVMEQLDLGNRRKKSTVIHDGLSEQELAPVTGEHAARKRLRIGIVGRIAKWKGQHVFLDAAAKVTKAGHDAEYVIVGAPLFGEEEYEAGLKKQAAEAGIAERVNFMGFKKDVAGVMRDELDVVVHASISGEPFGQVITEGMAAGKPVIATRGGGVPEIIEHDVNGLLTPMGDADALAAEIISLITDPAKLQRVADAGYAHVRRNFTAGSGARKVEEIYSNIGVKRYAVAGDYAHA